MFLVRLLIFLSVILLTHRRSHQFETFSFFGREKRIEILSLVIIWLFLFKYQNSGTGLAACPRLHYTTIVAAVCRSSCGSLYGESECMTTLTWWFLNMQMTSRDNQMLKSFRIFMKGAFSVPRTSQVCGPLCF